MTGTSISNKQNLIDSTENYLIILTRLPREGKTKTRLIPALGAAGAAQFHDRLAKHTFAKSSEFCKIFPKTHLVTRLEGGSVEQGQAWLGRCDFKAQGTGDLGERIKLAFREAFDAGAKRVVVIGTDCPDISYHILESAFLALEENEIVYGPARDGGYYLVGLTKLHHSLFEKIEWGGANVLDQSLAAAHRLKIQPTLLEVLSDVDVPDDLPAAEIALSKP
jgi:uncharacterized protein